MSFSTMDSKFKTIVPLFLSIVQSFSSSFLNAPPSRTSQSPLDGLRSVLRLRAVAGDSAEIVVPELRDDGTLRNLVEDPDLPLRSVIWKIFLLFRCPPFVASGTRLSDDEDHDGRENDDGILVSVDTDYSEWITRLNGSRQNYEDLRQHKSSHPAEDNFQLEIENLIIQDVDRCLLRHSDPYFATKEAKELMLSILLTYARHHPDIGYLQGMHDILAIVLQVVRHDALQIPPDNQDQLPHSLTRSDDSDTALRVLLDSRYIEHDASTLFTILISAMFSPLRAPGSRSSQRSVGPSAPKEDPFSRRICKILGPDLAVVDPALKDYMDMHDISAHIFMYRWIRMLFAHDFPLDQVLPLWDSIFAQDWSLGIVDNLCLVLLIRIREQILHGTVADSQQLLSRYTSTQDGNVAEGGSFPACLVYQALEVRDVIMTKSAGSSGDQNGWAKWPGSNSKWIPSSLSAALSSKLGGPIHSTSLFPSAFAEIGTSGGEALGKALRSRIEKTAWGTNMNKAVSGVIRGLQSHTPHPLAEPIMKLEARLCVERQRQIEIAGLMKEEIEKLWKVHAAMMGHNEEREMRACGCECEEGTSGKNWHNVSSTDPHRDDKEGVASLLTEAVGKLQFLQVALANGTVILPHRQSFEREDRVTEKRKENLPVFGGGSADVDTGGLDAKQGQNRDVLSSPLSASVTLSCPSENGSLSPACSSELATIPIHPSSQNQTERSAIKRERSGAPGSNSSTTVKPQSGTSSTGRLEEGTRTAAAIALLGMDNAVEMAVKSIPRRSGRGKSGASDSSPRANTTTAPTELSSSNVPEHKAASDSSC